MRRSNSRRQNGNWGSEVITGFSNSLRRCSGLRILFALIFPALALWASQPWTRSSAGWTADDVRRILADSPWAQAAPASFAHAETPDPVPVASMPGAAQAGMAGPNGVPDGRWDGGVGRNVRAGTPSLSVIVRWDSARPVRQALQMAHALNEPGISAQPEYTPQQLQRDYIVTVIGLVPAGRYRGAGRLETKSQSGDTTESDPRDPEEMLEGLMTTSKLIVRGRAAIAAEDVKLDPANGALHLFFPRTNPIRVDDKEILFTTRFGSMTIDKKFRLKDMIFNKELDL